MLGIIREFNDMLGGSGRSDVSPKIIFSFQVINAFKLSPRNCFLSINKYV
jgi:hypothetical protein